MNYKIDMSQIKTRVYIYGKDNLSIKTIPTNEYHKKGTDYIECFDFFKENDEYSEENKKSFIYEEVIEDYSITDVDSLYMKGLIFLLNNCRPKIKNKDDINGIFNDLTKIEGEVVKGDIGTEKSFDNDILDILKRDTKSLTKVIEKLDKFKEANTYKNLINALKGNMELIKYIEENNKLKVEKEQISNSDDIYYKGEKVKFDIEQSNIEPKKDDVYLDVIAHTVDGDLRVPIHIKLVLE